MSESSKPSYGEKISEDMTMGKLVEILPKDGTPVRFGGMEIRYHGSYPLDIDWAPQDQARRMGEDEVPD